MLGGADNPNGELPSYITGADNGTCSEKNPPECQQECPLVGYTALTVKAYVSCRTVSLSVIVLRNADNQKAKGYLFFDAHTAL